MKGYTAESGLLVVDPIEAAKRAYANNVSKTLSAEQKSLKTRPGLLQRRDINRVMELPDGTRINVWVDESGVASEHEYDDHRDAIVFPTTYHHRRNQ